MLSLKVSNRSLQTGYRAAFLRRFHGPVLSRDNENDCLRPNVCLDAFSQCAGDCSYFVVRIAVIHSMRKSTFPRGTLDFSKPVVFLHIGVQVFIVLPAWATTEFDANKKVCQFFFPCLPSPIIALPQSMRLNLSRPIGRNNRVAGHQGSGRATVSNTVVETKWNDGCPKVEDSGIPRQIGASQLPLLA